MTSSGNLDIAASSTPAQMPYSDAGHYKSVESSSVMGMANGLPYSPSYQVDKSDPEKGAQGEQERLDPIIVTWEGGDDPADPKNWPLWRKWIATMLVSLGGLVTLMSGAMLAPALSEIGHDLHISDSEAQIVLSIYVLAFGFGPLLFGPCSEVFGRKYIWLGCSLCYAVWNMICGFAHTRALMIASRFLAGIGASGHFAVSLPVLSDCWKSEDRGKSFALATLFSLLGPAVGPIIGGYITEGLNWRWLFWIISIFDAILMLLVLFLFKETYTPSILAAKARHLKRTTGRDHLTEFQRSNPDLSSKLKTSLMRPFQMLITEPIIQLMSLLLAYNFGILYIVLSTFATLWMDKYGQSTGESGLNYIAQVIGYTLAAQIGGPLTDRIWRHLKEKNEGATVPEYRVPLMIPGAVLIPIGLLWYGWSAEARLPWIMPDVGVAIFGCGIILGSQAMQAYVMEAFIEYTASATAASQFLRNIFAFGFPIFAPKMYSTLGYGWGNTLLASLFLLLGIPAPFILWKSGALLRKKGRLQS